MSEVTLESLVSFCKRRGFVYPSSEIYGGLAAVYDYGPYGVELINNIKQIWWRELVYRYDNISGLDSAIFMNPRVWQASGHVAGFSDPLTECRYCHTRLRVDHLLEGVGAEASDTMSETEINQLFDDYRHLVVCPECGHRDFTQVRHFNLLVHSNLGNFTGNDSNPVYLRGETCQGIYVNYKNILDSTRLRLPFGIAQIGKAFRNEITARQFIFRTREFEQMELQYFVRPTNDLVDFNLWKQRRWDYYINILGIDPANLRWHEHEKLAFYAKAACDIEYNFPFGFQEIEGVHARGDYDLTQHQKFSGQELDYYDQAVDQKFIPHIIESSSGVGRVFLMLLNEAYHEEKLGENDKRVVLKLKPALAPVKVAVFPLLRNKPELIKAAQEVFDQVKMRWRCEFDDNGNVGKRYRRQDEIGTPYCLTVDFDTLEKGTVTVRDRDTMKQTTVQLNELVSYLSSKLDY
ncbi:MAG TPA: glycine--tRNA ligase [bacterium]|jgi:glycyl-tRNA synthetase|nr:glycine--tRNA ligase [bacterium]HNZ51336.1 glycine--tRNA ligase [bacterium]HOH85197.1 glycine--tRNA ligase [bacterium]HPW44499.1 glycine--tRNA ligase [bacterium]HPX64212.1 glycine--tRNA ligase [bacterium]